MKITLHTERLSNTDALILRALADALERSETFPAQEVQPQPAVGDNTGSEVACSHQADLAEDSVELPPMAQLPEAPSPSLEPELDEPKPRRGRPPKLEQPVVEQITIPVPLPLPEPPIVLETEVTLDEVKDRLKSYVAKNGLSEGILLLKEFGCARISELDRAQYPQFIERCG